jgi:hypothetical protein
VTDDCRMFVRCFAELGYPLEDVRSAALGHPRRWLDTIDGATDGSSFRCDVGPGPRWQEVRKQVRIRLGKPTGGPARLVIPMTWTPTGANGLFPRLEGSLEISRLEHDLTLIALMAQYEPPLGALGRLVDGLLLHRVATSTLREFNNRLATNLDEVVKLDRKVAQVFSPSPAV